MSFFSPLPPADAEEPAVRPLPPWHQPPSGEVPVPLPAARILARRPGIALTLRRIDVYSIGCRFRLELDARREDGMGEDVWDDLMDGLHLHRTRHRDLERSIRFGVKLADGQTAETEYGHLARLGLDHEPTGPMLSLRDRGGGGDTHHYSMGYGLWLWPLPPAGPLTLHFQWLQLGIAEGSVELDATPIVAAAPGVLPIWD